MSSSGGTPRSPDVAVPSSVEPIRVAASATVNAIPPSASIRPGRRGVSQPDDAAQPSTSAMMPMGTLT
jgi:hypothetical protein